MKSHSPRVLLEALHTISPDLPYDDWVRVGMAVHASALTFQDFDEWSAKGSAYKPKETRQKWASFNSDSGIGTGTLIHIAKEHGWHGIDIGSAPTQSPIKRSRPSNPDAVWERCEAASNKHSYVIEKQAQGIPLDDLRVVPYADPLTIAGESMAGALVVPVRKPDGALTTLQFIAPPDVAERLKANDKPGKLNLPGCPVQGWFTVGVMVPGSVVYIVEGIGQAWACWQATGAAAVVCFGAGNMRRVAAELRHQDNAARLVVVPDAGKEKQAAEIAAEVQGQFVTIPQGWEQNEDVNDFAQRDGMDALKLLLQGSSEPPKPEPLLKKVSVGDVISNPSEKPAFAWKGYLPRGVVTLMSAHGGSGKSTIALMLAVSVALGRALFGVDTQQCKVLFVSLEDGTSIVRHRLAHICRMWFLEPEQLRDSLQIVDGTEHPELFAAETRGIGGTTSTYSELRLIVQTEGVGLVIVDNASDAFGGDEIQRRQVRAFMRALGEVAKLTNCGVMLLAHVDKATSRNGAASGAEGYSGSTAWHNSARSRLFVSRGSDGLLKLEHQKCNFGKMCEPIALDWPDGGLPQLVGDRAGVDMDDILGSLQDRADDEHAVVILNLIAEFESRKQYCSPAITSRNHVHAVLKSDPAFKKRKLLQDDTKRIVTQCQRAKWIEQLDYRTPDRKPHQRWTLTTEGRLFAGLPAAPTAPTAPTTEDGASLHMAQGSAPTAPTGVGGMGERVHTQDGAKKRHKAKGIKL